MAETATMTDFNLTLERRLDAPRERVYKAWTDPDEVRRHDWCIRGAGKRTNRRAIRSCG